MRGRVVGWLRARSLFMPVSWDFSVKTTKIYRHSCGELRYVVPYRFSSTKPPHTFFQVSFLSDLGVRSRRVQEMRWRLSTVGFRLRFERITCFSKKMGRKLPY